MNTNKVLVILISVLIIVVVILSLIAVVRKDSMNSQQTNVVAENDKGSPAVPTLPNGSESQPQDSAPVDNTTPVPAKGYAYYLGTEFYPAEITLRRGEAMNFINRTIDAAEFDATNGLQVSKLNSLGVFTQTFNNPGTYVVTPKGKSSPSLTITVQ